MKTASTIFLFTFVLIGLALPVSSVAEGDAPSASGSYQILVDNITSRNITFNASSAGDGSTTGEITFRDVSTASSAKVVRQQPGDDPTFFVKAKCDCLKINGVEAVLSGTVSESSREGYIGRRVVLVVQDGDSLTPALRDKLTWGFYRSTAKNWVATDAERPDEEPAATWLATDAERPDDAGKTSQNGDEVNCESFPISSYSFVDSKSGRGKIEIRR